MKTNYKTIQKVLYWITICWFKNVPNSVCISKAWINQVEKWETCNGPVWTIAHVKMMRQLLFSHISGNPQKVVNQIIGINKNTGLPKAFNSFIYLIQSGDKTHLRFVLTLLSISRLLPGMKQPDLSTITKPSNANQVFIKYLEKYMIGFLSEYKWNYNLPHWFNKGSLRFSPKAGPNGSASRTALFDLISMPGMLKNILMDLNIKTVIKEYEDLLAPKRVEFYHMVQQFWPKYEKINDKIREENLKNKDVFKRKPLLSPSWFNQFKLKPVKGYIRKLSVVNDPEAKARIIAIFDYWSQSFLRQIHEIHFDFLKRIPMDRTFTQDPILPKPPEGHKYYSFDLSAATDRFPMVLQELLMKSMFGEDISTRWRMILTSFPFFVPWLSKDKETFVSYSAGQPMGAYSSWSTFTISHHFILYVIHKELDLAVMHYQILGDDIVIWHDKVAERYLEMMKELDVGISIPKSNISFNMYEFAKRVFLDGVEITGIQLGGFVNVVSKYHLVYQNLYTLIYERRYVPLNFLSIPELLDQLHLILGLQPKMRKNLLSRVKLLHGMTKFIQLGDKTELVNRLNELFPECEDKSFHLPDIEINNLIYLSCDKILGKVNAQYINYAKRLMSNSRLVEQAAVGLGCPSDLYTSPVHYISKLPIMRGLINNITLQNKARKLDSIKDIVKAIALPTDNIFEKKNGILLGNCHAKLAKIFLAEFKSSQVDNRLAGMPDGISGGTVLSYIASDLNRMVPKDIGMGIETPVPKSPYKPTDWGLSCNNDVMN